MSTFGLNSNGSAKGSSLVSLFGEMVRLPIVALTFAMEMLVKTVQTCQRIADHGLDALTEPVEAVPKVWVASPQQRAAVSSEQQDPKPEEVRKEQLKMPDTNLNDDMLKLVRYKILFVKRDYEVAFPEQEELVYDNMTDTAFTAWKVAEFIQSLDNTVVPLKWSNKNYPPGRRDTHVHTLPEDDKKYLRVYFEVMQRYTREKFKHDEREVEELESIRRILDRHLGGTDGGGAQPAPTHGAPTTPAPESGLGSRGGKPIRSTD